MEYVIAHDVGTQSNKAALIGSTGAVVDSCEFSYAMDLPRPNWAEQNPADYWQAVCAGTNLLTGRLNTDDKILAMVFSTQSMGIIPIDSHGKILYPNISWVDSRADHQAKKIANRFFGQSVLKAISGVELSGKDVIPKLLWLKEERPDIYKKTYRFLDVNGYLKYRCTGKMVAEWSGASSYGFNLKKKDWERLFFKIAGIDLDKLPLLVKSTDFIGNLTPEAAAELGLTTEVKIFGGCDDTQSAAIGSGQVSPHSAHVYLGTSAWLGVSHPKPVKFKRGVANLASADPNSTILVGITESAGANLEWALENLYKQEKKGSVDIYGLMESEVAAIPSGADGLIFTPWFQGERAPVTNTTLRATLFNLGLEHTRGHIICALLEGIGYNLKWIMENMQHDYGFPIRELTLIGGGSVNSSWIQSLSDILQIPLHTTKQPKMAGAIGCAMTALVGMGLAEGFYEVKKYNPRVKTFTPRPDHEQVYQEGYEHYKVLYSTLKGMYKKINGKRFNPK